MNGVLQIERRQGGRWAVVPLVAAVFAAGGWLVSRLHLDHLPFSVCAFKATTGLPCMTCGTTRALARLMRFDLMGAVRVQPLATAALLSLAAWAAVDLALLTRGRRLRLSIDAAHVRWLLILGALAALANWAYLIRAGV
jgi:hypothetical protein